MSQVTGGRSQRGAALLLVLMVTVVLLILMGTLIDVLAMESQNAIESADSDAALTAAYSGVDLMILAIEEFYQNGVQNGNPPQSTTCNFGAPVGTTITTTCIAKVAQSWNGTGLNYYLINSTGFATPSQAQQVQRSVSALVKEVPFGAYAMFTETDTSNTGVHVWYSSGQAFTGPVYSGGDMHIRYDSGYDHCSQPPCPIFPYGFTTVGNKNDLVWYDIADNDPSAPDTPAELASVYGPGGQASFVHNSISLPGLAQNLVVFSESYYGDANHADLTDLQNAGCNQTVCVNGGASSGCSQQLCTGIFINGSADVQATSVAGTDLTSGSQTWTFSPPDKNSGDPNPISNTVTVTVNFNQGTTTVTDGGNSTVYQGLASGSGGNSGLGNGAIFVNGDLTVLDNASVHGQYTVAVPDPPQHDESMTINGNLQYSANPQTGQSQDELALWADKIWLNSTDPGLTIDGMLLTGYAGECTNARKCGGYFANQNCNVNGCNEGTGTLNLYGSTIENMHGMMGVVDQQGHLQSGYLRNAAYDPRLGAVPPPFSPTTNLYDVIAVGDQGSL